jgi:hypothetical protein
MRRQQRLASKQTRRKRRKLELSGNLSSSNELTIVAQLVLKLFRRIFFRNNNDLIYCKQNRKRKIFMKKAQKKMLMEAEE